MVTMVMFKFANCKKLPGRVSLIPYRDLFYATYLSARTFPQVQLTSLGVETVLPLGSLQGPITWLPTWYHVADVATELYIPLRAGNLNLFLASKATMWGPQTL